MLHIKKLIYLISYVSKVNKNNFFSFDVKKKVFLAVILNFSFLVADV